MKYIKQVNHEPVALHSGITKFNFLNRERTCACGHHMKYHIQGVSKCLFGVCACDHYDG